MDELKERILIILRTADEPLTTEEIVRQTGRARHLVRYRLFKLVSEGRIGGKQTKERGSWIWWWKG